MNRIKRLASLLLGRKEPELVLRSFHEKGEIILDISTGHAHHIPGTSHFFINDEEVTIETYMRVGLRRAPINKNYHEVPCG